MICFDAHAACEYQRENGTTMSINECYGHEVKKSDEKILNVYSSYRQTLDTEGKKELLNLQRSWINYKLKQCSHEVAQYGRGSIVNQLYSQCMINMNDRRIDELRYLGECNLASSSGFCATFRDN